MNQPYSPQVMVANPSVAPFVQQACLAFQERQMLHSFLSSLVADADHWVNKSASRLLGRRWQNAVKRRQLNPAVLPYLSSLPYWELGRLAVSRIDKQGLWTDAAWQKSQRQFDRWSSRQIVRHRPDVFYGYETCCRGSFKVAEELGIQRIYEVCAIEHKTFHDLLRRELDEFPELNTRYTEHVFSKEAERTAWRQSEWDAAQKIIVYSEYCKNTYREAGYDISNVHALPLGCPPVTEVTIRDRKDSPLKVIWAGTFSIRKGAHYCLQAWQQLNASGKFGELHVYGTATLPEKLLADAPDSVRFHGPVPWQQVMDAYLEADVLLFPTLSDSFGMVVGEAFASGLPVITTRSAGAADLVKHQENGLIIEPGDPQAICEALQWFDQNRQALPQMKHLALDTAAGWQWQDYRKALYGVVMAGS